LSLSLRIVPNTTESFSLLQLPLTKKDFSFSSGSWHPQLLGILKIPQDSIWKTLLLNLGAIIISSSSFRLPECNSLRDVISFSCLQLNSLRYDAQIPTYVFWNKFSTPFFFFGMTKGLLTQQTFKSLAKGLSILAFLAK